MSLHCHCLKELYDEWHIYSVSHIKVFIKWHTKVAREIHIIWTSIFNGLLHLLYFLAAVLFNKRLKFLNSSEINILLEELLLEPNPLRINSVMLCLSYLCTWSLNMPLYIWYLLLHYRYFSFSDYSLTLSKQSLLYYPISIICAVQLIDFQVCPILVWVLFLHRCCFSPTAADLHA